MRREWLVGLSVFTAVASLSVAGLALYKLQPTSMLPAAVSKQVKFAVFYPTSDQKTFSVDKKTISYNKNTQVLHYTVNSGNQKIIINQQLEPDTFNETGNGGQTYYDYLLGKMHEYDELNTSTGKVALTRPSELNGGQAAVLDARGTLLFAQPSQDWSKDQWQNFFESLDVVK